MGGRCRTEYSEGTAVARESSEYLEGTTEEMEVVMCDWPSLWNKKGYLPFLEILLKMFYNFFY
jgi:hypothetical protein